MSAFESFGIPVVDIDSHWTEPADLWTSRAPAKYRDLVPHLTRVGAKDRWLVNGDVPFGNVGTTVIRNDGSKEYGVVSLDRLEDMDAGATEPKARVKRLDDLGVYAQLLYPNVTGFGNTNFMRIKDTELRTLCSTTYNDAIADLQREGQGRLYPQAVIPFWDLDAAVRELRRIKDMGLTGIAMCDKPEVFGMPNLADPAWAPFWSACQEMDIPVNFHIGAGGQENVPSFTWGNYSMQRWLAVISVSLFIDNFRVIVNLIFSGLLDRYPNLKFVSVESGIGWIPFVLEAMEYQFDETCPTDREGLSLRPTEYFRRQIYASFWFEKWGPKNTIDAIGVDNVMFETDYPHPTCLYPGAQEHVRTVLAELDPVTRRKILRDTAVKLYKLPVPEPQPVR